MSPAGSPKLTDNGWYTPSCEGAHRLIFEERDGVLTYKTYLMVNDSSPGDPLFTDDLLRALYPEDFYRSSPSSAAYCVEVARPQTEVIKLTAFSQAARLNGVVPDGGNVEVWYLAWQDHLGDIGLVSSTYYTYCFFFMDADGALLHAQAAQVTGDDLYDDAQALWDAYTAS